MEDEQATPRHSHWDKLPPEIKDRIYRQTRLLMHREKKEQGWTGIHLDIITENICEHREIVTLAGRCPISADCEWNYICGRCWKQDGTLHSITPDEHRTWWIGYNEDTGEAITVQEKKLFCALCWHSITEDLEREGKTIPEEYRWGRINESLIHRNDEENEITMRGEMVASLRNILEAVANAQTERQYEYACDRAGKQIWTTARSHTDTSSTRDNSN